jgi:6-phosphogluconolactonase (cycloisomerase 2 family)
MAKLTKLYGTPSYYYSDEPYRQCLWSDEEYVFVGGYPNVGVIVYKINSDGSLTKKDQIITEQNVVALWNDGRFLYVGISNDDINNGMRIFKVESDGTLTLKDTIPIDSMTYGWLTGITGDGRFVYVATSFNLT